MSLKEKEAYFEIANDQERNEFTGIELARLNEAFEKLHKVLEDHPKSKDFAELAKSTDLKELVQSVVTNLGKLQKSYTAHSEESKETFKEMHKGFVDGLKRLERVLEECKKPRRSDKFYDDFSTSLIQLNGYSKRTSELISNLKWNTWMGVKDSNGTPINPAIAGFNITSPYDYIALTYSGSNVTMVKYYSGGASGTLVATLTLAYSGSNVISVTRT